MIETEEQRRWWFATHPEYSWSHRGIRGGSGAEKNEDAVDPRDVDEYVNNALEHETDKSVIALLESVKRNFGTEAELSKEQQNLKAWIRILEDGWGTPAGTYADGGLLVSELPRMPTMDELSRWPREMVGQFFKWLDTLLQNNPLLINPNALERHHLLVKRFAQYFMDCGLDVESFVIIMRAADHRLKPDGLHTGKGRGGDWNSEWKEFIDQWPDPDNSKKHQGRIREKLKDMKKRYRIDEKKILSPGKPRSR
jgi:hypothetical protein